MKNELGWGVVFSAIGAAAAAQEGVATATPSPVVAAAAPRAAAGGPELAVWQRELLQLAFDAASAFPIEPHGKNRSRAQDVVVTTCFELDQPDLALAYATQMVDWRRGCAFADYAWCMARRGQVERAREYVKLAEGVVAEQKADPTAQQWRIDLIDLKRARALTAAGETAGAAAATAGIDPGTVNAVDADWASTASERARLIAPADVPKELAAIDSGFPAMSLGRQHVALATLAGLHDRFYADEATRRFCEERVARTWTRVVPALRLETLAAFVRTAVTHGDRAGGRALVATMREIVEAHRWRAEDRMPQAARLIECTFLVGDADRARADAEAALRAWHEERDAIVSIWRAESLRPLALAWHTLGDGDKAQELLALVVEESLENPNSRPRCDDLVDTCTALVRHGVAPSASLMTRLREVRQGLRDPW